MSDQSYQPDPAAETRMVIDAFFAALADSLPARHDLISRLHAQHDLTPRLPARPDLIARLHARHERLLAGQQHRVVDDASRYNLALSLAVLAGYQELTPEIGDDELLPLLRTAFVEPLRSTVQEATAATLDAAADPFTAMTGISRQREQYAFGAGFTFTHPYDDADHYVAQVERCYYHEVLRANGAAHLTPVLCAFDANWIDAIDPPRHGFEFDRPTTIGLGGPHCPFQFRRTRP